jgi:DNA-binding NtrC family response regulator
MRNKEVMRVLIVDDETSVRDALVLAFEMADESRFEVTAVSSLDECVEIERDGKANFDICVIDLGFGPQSEFLAGFRVLSGLGCLRSGGVGIVYTGFPTIRNAVIRHPTNS